MRANVYIDGFNLYFGAVRNTPYRWLNLRELSRRLLRAGHELNRVRYFTARVESRPHALSAPERQAVYIRALETLPELSIHWGLFRTHPRALPLADGTGMATVLRTEEKGSDVNLATYLLLDAFDGDYDTALVVSNDTDLLLPIVEVRRRFSVTVGISCPVYQPGRHPHRELVEAADFNVHITRKRKKLLRECQFPDVLSDVNGTFHKPPGW